MDEDERYRTSTQYKLWSFTHESLAKLRQETNRVAAYKARDAIQRARASKATARIEKVENGDNESDSGNGMKTDKSGQGIDVSDVECLTVDEELKLVAFYCRQLLQMGDHLSVPTDVKASALQYLRRFYLTSSLMTYPAQTILKTCLYLATKTENHYISLSKFSSSIQGTSADSIRASEFLLTQGLRFTFDVRHPFRALEGAVMELHSIADGAEDLLGNTIAIPQALRSHTNETGSETVFSNRVKTAHGTAREYLKNSALLTDVYFHYTPSQIMLSSLLIADEELTTFYISTKFPNPATADIRSKLLATLQTCADILRCVSPNLQPPDAELKELRTLAKKLKKCQNPENMDLVALSKATKRGEGGNGDVDQRAVKKRKMEREKVEREVNELFGGELKKVS